MPAADKHGNRVIYNGITILNVLTRGVEEELYMDPDKTNHVATRVKISLTGILHGSLEAAAGSGDDAVPKMGAYVGTPPSGTTTDLLTEAIEDLNQQRKPFSYWIGNIPLYAVWPIDEWSSRSSTISDGSGEADGDIPTESAYPVLTENAWMASLENTPTVQTSITKVISDNSAHIAMDIEFIYIPCLTDRSNDDHEFRHAPEWVKARTVQRETGTCEGWLPNWTNILSMRWSMADNIDASDWLTERSYRGVIRLTRKVAKQEGRQVPISPHYLRFLTIPPLQRGFKRKSLSFNESPDNLSLEFEITDKEVYVQPPYPACDFEATSTTSVNPFAGGMNSVGKVSVDVSLTARKNVDKKLLLQAMTHIINAKTNFLHTITNFSTFVTSFTVSESLHANKINGTVEVIIKPFEGGGNNPYKSVMKMLTDTFGQADSGNRGLTSTTIPQQKWGADQAYDPQNVRIDLLNPDECVLLGKLSSVFVPTVIDRTVSPARARENTPCEPIVGYPWGEDRGIGPITELSIKPVSQRPINATNERHGDGPLQSTVEVRQAGPFAGSDIILGNQRKSSLWDLSNQYPYMHYSLDMEYEVDSGRTLHGFSSMKNGQAATVHDRFVAKAYKVFSFVAARVNRRPVLPANEDWFERIGNGGIYHWILKYKLKVNSSVVSASGDSVLFVASGKILVGMSRPYYSNENVFVPSSPDIGSLNDLPQSAKNFAINQFNTIPGGTEYWKNLGGTVFKAN